MKSWWGQWTGSRGTSCMRMVVDRKVHFKAWDPGGTQVLSDDKVYCLHAYEEAELERKIHAHGIKAKELWGQVVEWDSLSMVESSAFVSYFLVNKHISFLVFVLLLYFRNFLSWRMFLFCFLFWWRVMFRREHKSMDEGMISIRWKSDFSRAVFHYISGGMQSDKNCVLVHGMTFT